MLGTSTRRRRRFENLKLESSKSIIINFPRNVLIKYATITSSTTTNGTEEEDNNSESDDIAFALTEYPQLGMRDVGFHFYEASKFLASHLLWTTSHDFSQMDVLELGSGVCGLAGLACARRNAHSVTFTDSAALPELLERLSLNVRRNVSSLVAVGSEAKTRVKSGAAAAPPRVATTKRETEVRARVLPLDWDDECTWEASFEEDERFDMVVAADCIYSRKSIGPFLRTLQRFASTWAYIAVEVRDASVIEEFEREARAVPEFPRMRALRRIDSSERLPEHIKLYVIRCRRCLS